MSAIELAVRKVRKLSAQEARELLSWLAARPPNGGALPTPSRKPRRKTTARQRMKKLKAWHDSVRLTTDWEPPRMPDDRKRPPHCPRDNAPFARMGCKLVDPWK